MRLGTIIMIVLSIGFGVAAVFFARNWIERQADLRIRAIEANATVRPQATGATIVVAARPLRFGTDLSAEALREIPWAADALPAGAFAHVSDLTGTGERRVVVAAMDPNEPVLATKITGPGQRATLSAVLTPGMKAVTVRASDLLGVAGFILPGDRIDLALTRQSSNTSGNTGQPGGSVTDMLLQNVRVLAIDQSADERADKPLVAKSVTVEVDAVQAQKIVLASQVGTLSLILRRPGDAEPQSVRRVTMADLGDDEPVAAVQPDTQPAELAKLWQDRFEALEARVTDAARLNTVAKAGLVEPVAAKPEPARKADKQTIVSVTRAMHREEYTVPAETPR